MSVYALKQPHPNGGEWIQEHDSLEDALEFQSHSGGILVRREAIPGQPGLWWVEVNTELPSDVGSVVQSEPNEALGGLRSDQADRHPTPMRKHPQNPNT